ncbi:MAG: TIGR02594 family protein [Tardiphaga sp.]
MVQFFAFRRALRVSALAVCSAIIFAATMFASVSPASARSHHGASRHHHVSHHAYGHRHYRGRHSRRHAQAGESEQSSAFGDSNGGMMQSSGGFGGSGVVAAARSFIGHGNPTGRGRLWCAAFMNLVLKRTGHQGTGSDMARSFSSYGQRISGPQVGAIAVMSRGRRGGHVGVVSGIDDKGNPIIVSGNHGNRVAESVYSRGRIYAYVMPTS